MSLNKNFENFDNQNNYEISIKYLFNGLIRNKKLIVAITFISVLISFISQKISQKTWGGEFQIVLSNNSMRKPLASGLQSTLGLTEGNNELKTQVGILESPSILMPIFEYVKNQKSNINSEKSDLNFFDWKENIKINLKKNTSILDITYLDKDKEVIIPVLEKMSKAFQNYSGKNKLRNIELTKNYLIDQIKIYKNKSAESIKKAQLFAMREDLLINDLLTSDSSPLMNSDSQNNYLPPYARANTSIESKRVRASNKIRNLREQIIRIEELNVKDPQQIQYIGSTIKGLKAEGLPDKLKLLENELVTLRTKYTEKDKAIIILLEKRNLLINLLKERAIGMLNAEIVSLEAAMKSATRAEGVLLKYKELMREAERDERTLLNLENKYREILLTEAKTEDPWELITEPTLYNNYLFPKLRNFILFGIFSGLAISLPLIAYLEKKSGKVFEKDIIEDYFSVPILIQPSKNQKDDYILDSLLINEIIKNNDNISFLKVGDINQEEINKLKNIFNTTFQKKELIKKLTNIENNYEEQIQQDVLLLINWEKLTFPQLSQAKKRIRLLDLKLKGIFLI